MSQQRRGEGGLARNRRYHNVDAWVAHANVERFTRTGVLDVDYLSRGLSPDAYPTLVQSLPRLPAPERAALSTALRREYRRRPMMRDDLSWFE